MFWDILRGGVQTLKEYVALHVLKRIQARYQEAQQSENRISVFL